MTDLDRRVEDAVAEWRQKGYEGVSRVTGRLLDYWFKEEHHFDNGRQFDFWRCQREAMEALIYCYEICGYDSLYALAQGFGVRLFFDPTLDLWPRYCFRMATGSGKTFVMGLSLVWQYFNSVYGTDNGVPYSRHFLLVAPNLIVLDRLGDFEDSKLFHEWPFFVPPEWENDFDLQTVIQTEDVPAHSRGILHITNVQQFYERGRDEEPENPILAQMPPRPVHGEEFKSRATLYDILGRYDDLLILNDEAHHAHPDTEWQEAMERLHEQLKEGHDSGLTMQLDFSATPMDADRNLFPHIIYNYPLGEAIEDEIVKRPHIGVIEGMPEPIGDDFVHKHQIQIDEGVELLKQFQDDLEGTGKKPVLFVMCDTVKNADRVGAYLENERGFKDKVLVIHTYQRSASGFERGDVKKAELPKIRKAAKEIDTNQYQIIVSVMMLKEGWDVKNVCAIVPLRAYKSAILVEQTLGRGLRRMFPEAEELEEKLIVVEHPSFRELWQAEIREGDLGIEVSSVSTAYEPSNKIAVDESKLQYDIEIPLVRGGITRVAPDLSQLNIADLPREAFTYADIPIPTPHYVERDLMTKEITAERDIDFGYTDRYDEYLSHMTKAVLYKVGSASQFATLLPLIKAYIENYLLDVRVAVREPTVIGKLNHLYVRNKIKDVFVEALSHLSRMETNYRTDGAYKVSDTKPVHTSRPIFAAEKTVFDCLPYPKNSDYERVFMVYLDDQPTVLAYTKVLSRFPLRIPYYDQDGILRHYLPDFIVKTEEGFYLMETKGTGFDEMASVALKDTAATHWCRNVSELTGQTWTFAKIPQEEFDDLKYLAFEEMVRNLAV